MMTSLRAGWFQGLSSSFLTARTARLLVLAGTDRLDKELMIGQMQGKFQMVVVPGVGHMLHEVRVYGPFC
jgi:protein phosphatase methylesterase 1